MDRLYRKMLKPPRRFSLYVSGVATSTPTPNVENFTPIPTFEEVVCPGLLEAGSDASEAAFPPVSPPATSSWGSRCSMEFGETAATISWRDSVVAADTRSKLGTGPKSDCAKQFP